MKTFVILLLSVITLNLCAQEKQTVKKEKTVIFHTDIDCPNCKKKIEQNITYEKGVKNLIVDLNSKTVAITYRTDKNDEASLRKALEALDVKVTDNQCDPNCPNKGKCHKGECHSEKHHEGKDCCHEE